MMTAVVVMVTVAMMMTTGARKPFLCVPYSAEGSKHILSPPAQ